MIFLSIFLRKTGFNKYLKFECDSPSNLIQDNITNLMSFWADPRTGEWLPFPTPREFAEYFVDEIPKMGDVLNYNRHYAAQYTQCPFCSMPFDIGTIHKLRALPFTYSPYFHSTYRALVKGSSINYAVNFWVFLTPSSSSSSFFFF